MSAELDQSLVEECVGSAHGDLARVRDLVERHPALVNARAPWNETPIEAATQLGRKDIIDYLLSKGARLDFSPPACWVVVTWWRPSWRAMQPGPGHGACTTSPPCTSPPSAVSVRSPICCMLKERM